jgi:hypothetical protein
MDTGITKELKNNLFAHIFADLFAKICADSNEQNHAPKRTRLGARRGDGPMQVVSSRFDRANRQVNRITGEHSPASPPHW